MPQKALAGVLVVGRQAERRQQLSHRHNDFVGEHVLNLTAVNADNMVRARLVDARNNPALTVRKKRRLHLVAIVVGVVHADNRLHPAKALEQLNNLALLKAQLLGIA